MAITNHTTPKTANGIAYFFPNTTFTVGQITPQKNTAPHNNPKAGVMPTPHNNMRKGVKFFLIKLVI